MILKASQRAGGMQLARHLKNTNDNDHVTLHSISGFASCNLEGAFKEAYAVSRGTRCKQFLFSLSLSPPETAVVKIGVFENAIQRIEEKLGLVGQPRVVVFHEKEGRRHAHCVWSRIDVDQMRAINLSHFKTKLMDISRKLYLENKWQLPLGFIDTANRNPFNFDLQEWQQAKRAKKDPRAIKEELQNCWAESDGSKAFKNSLERSGYYLARGDQRGFVVVDWQGEIYSISRWLGVKSKDIKERLGDANALPSVSDVQDTMAAKTRETLEAFRTNLRFEYQKSVQGLAEQKKQLVKRQREERRWLDKRLKDRKRRETEERAARFRHGFQGMWDRLSGKHTQIRKENELEFVTAEQRDTDDRFDLVKRHQTEQHEFKTRLKRLKSKFSRKNSEISSDDEALASSRLLQRQIPGLKLGL